jgi:A/G-specific adenine glycosylase
MLRVERVRQLQEAVWEYYRQHGRDLPWRRPEPDGSFDPYKILVSEVMLQQTQVTRVVPKYQAFLERFPNIRSLAAASVGDVIKAWNGLGYNRRAKYLWQAAQAIRGPFPLSLEELVKLPGIGKNTAGAILVYAYNQPLAFIETNIRTVYIHHFFADDTAVDDKELLPLVEQTLPKKGKEQPETRIHSAPGAKRKTVGLSHYREWYWALMDYGAYLKQTVGNLNRHSKHYVKQTPFEGSLRQVRGAVLRALAASPMTLSELQAIVPDSRLGKVLDALAAEGMIHRQGDHLSLH